VTQRVDLERTDGPGAGGNTPDGVGGPVSLEMVQQVGAKIAAAISTVVLGKPEVIRLAIIAVLAEGHLLIEDVPGTGKTVLAKSLARTVDSTVSRVQFTPDLMPSDVTGVSIYDRQSSQFEFRPGPIFANIVVADEINRASPKTQSALLECMEERQVTVDGTSYQLARPFLVLATQNPVEMEGTYPLPEAQRDRFLARLSIGYPDRIAEIGMLSDRDRTDPLAVLRPVTDAAMVSKLIDAVATVHLAPPLRQYIVEIVGATRAVNRTCSEARVSFCSDESPPHNPAQKSQPYRAGFVWEQRGCVGTNLQPHTSSASSTINPSFRSVISIGKPRPARAGMLAKPHCGETPTRSRSMYFAASSNRRLSMSLLSSSETFVETRPRTALRCLGMWRSGAKSPARGVSYSRKNPSTSSLLNRRSAIGS